MAAPSPTPSPPSLARVAIDKTTSLSLAKRSRTLYYFFLLLCIKKNVCAIVETEK